MQDVITSEVMPANKVTRNVIISFTPRLFSFQDPDPAFCHRTLNNSILTQLFSKTQSSFTGICIDFKKRYCSAARRRLCNIFFILTLFYFIFFRLLVSFLLSVNNCCAYCQCCHTKKHPVYHHVGVITCLRCSR